MPNPELAFYADPKVWSVVVALIALLLSQLPPIHKLFRRGKLELDVKLIKPPIITCLFFQQ